MTNVKLLFYGSKKSDQTKKELQVWATSECEIYIGIKDTNNECVNSKQFIVLNKETAIKLSRELRKQIALTEIPF